MVRAGADRPATMPGMLPAHAPENRGRARRHRSRTLSNIRSCDKSSSSCSSYSSYSRFSRSCGSSNSSSFSSSWTRCSCSTCSSSRHSSSCSNICKNTMSTRSSFSTSFGQRQRSGRMRATSRRQTRTTPAVVPQSPTSRSSSSHLWVRPPEPPLVGVHPPPPMPFPRVRPWETCRLGPALPLEGVRPPPPMPFPWVRPWET
mmetsp:Transcript_2764/g.5950  ORF Transcript_2764/g.5950 Transcript_2764/m.5950 type:complete len:202 (-) Transcript_2764:2514-3119(-)